MTKGQEELLLEFQEFSKTASANALMEQMARRLHEKMARYNWVGFYLVDPADPGILLVGPFVGSFTPNAAFPSTPDCAAQRRPRDGLSWWTMSPKIRDTSPGHPW